MQTNVRQWLAEMGEHFRENPIRAPLYLIYSWYLVAWFGVTSRFPVGTNVYERDWDLLVVLDACRVDTLREVADEYDFIEEVDEMWSIGSHSAEWIAQTFTESQRRDVEQTRYVTGNAHASRVLEERRTPPLINTLPVDLSRWNFVDTDSFDAIDMVWENYNDETYRVALPEVMTDYTIDVSRELDQNRLIVHYMQPHLPYIGQAHPEGRSPTELEMEGYEKLETGDADREEVYELYKDTLRLVLDQVELLLENVDADRVAITADHGEAFGELRAYGHPEGFPHPIVKKVPWVETTAEDSGTREPDLEKKTATSVDIEEHLKDLGYR
ncbi:hypothetical protein [Halobacterium yunchengense]|uniref:hypothetical protein n=1 Tax=Halobacterium yunchengense TaxID=3108497 RepID=UPI00300AD49A